MHTIVIGGGHSGLAAAAKLAKQGERVTLLERRSTFGGVMDGLLHDTETLSSKTVQDLDLASYGLRLQDPEPVFVPASSGSGILVHRDPALMGDELGSDLAAYHTYRAFLGRVLPFARTQLANTSLDLRADAPLLPLLKAGLAFRRLGKADIHELLRAAPSCVDDFLSDHFAHPGLRAALAAPALHGTFMGPRSPSSTATLLLHEAQVQQEVVGGPSALIEALLSACRAHHVELKTNAEVDRIDIAGGRATGVTLKDGSTQDADAILSCIGPRKTLLDLVAPEHLPPNTADQVSNIRLRGTLAKITLLLSEPITYACRPSLAPARSLLAENPMAFERAFDHAKHRRMPTNAAPATNLIAGACSIPLDIRQSDGSASILIRCATIELEGGWTDERRAELTETALASLAHFAPQTRQTATVTETLTPADIAERYALEGGHELHGELALDQLGPMRPTMELSGSATPIAGLRCASAGVHAVGALACD